MRRRSGVWDWLDANRITIGFALGVVFGVLMSR